CSLLGAVTHSTTPVATSTAPPRTKPVDRFPADRASSTSFWAMSTCGCVGQVVPPHTPCASLHLPCAITPNTTPVIVAAAPTPSAAYAYVLRCEREAVP